MRDSSLFVVAIVFLMAADAYGREVPDWPYDKLIKSADVVGKLLSPSRVTALAPTNAIASFFPKPIDSAAVL